MTFLKFFLTSMFKNPNLADIFTNLAKKKLNSAEFMEIVFSKSAAIESKLRIEIFYTLPEVLS